MTSTGEIADPTMLVTDAGYSLGFDGTTIIALNAKGKRLKSVPPAAKKTDEYRRLEQLREFLSRHDADVAAQVQRWLLGSYPVPGAVLAAVWPDDSWRAWLTDTVVADAAQAQVPLGFLREITAIDDGARLGVVDLDGESVSVDVAAAVFPHPLQLGAELADFAEFAAELGLTPKFDQLFRQVHVKPKSLHTNDIRDFAGARFAELRHATGRARSQGFVVQGAYAVCRTVADGTRVEARLWLGEGSPDYEAELGELSWTDGERLIPISDVPPVAFSEGMRMGTLIYAGRVVGKQEGDDQ